VDDERERQALVQRLLADARSRLGGLAAAWKLADRGALLDQFCSLLADSQPDVRQLAANHIELLRDAAENATNTLLERFEREPDGSVQLKLLDALEAVGTSTPDSAQVLFRAVMHGTPKIAYHALLALSKRDAELLNPYLAPLLRRFETSGDSLGPELAIVFGALGETAPPEVVSALAKRLDGVGPDDPRAANLILAALGNMGPAASNAVPAIERLAGHPSSSVRRNAHDILARLR
jgi:hypothetical protein